MDPPREGGNANYPTLNFDEFRASLGEGQHALLIEQPIQARIALSSLTDKTLRRFQDTGRMGKDKIGPNPVPARETVKNSPE